MSDERCPHPSHPHHIVGVGETEDAEPFATIWCPDCGTYWDEARAWSLGGDGE